MMKNKEKEEVKRLLRKLKGCQDKKQILAALRHSKTMVITLAGLGLMIFCSGCAVPLLLGVKSYKSAAGTEIKFITGSDISFGVSGTDTLNNQKGIAAEPTYYRGAR